MTPTPRRSACSTKHRAVLDRVAQTLLQKETLAGSELSDLLTSVPRESHAAETVGTVQALP